MTAAYGAACAHRDGYFMQLGGLVALGMIVPAILLAIVRMHHDSATWIPWVCGFLAVVLGSVGGTLLFKYSRLPGRYDLNAGYPNHVAPFPGEPVAIINRPPNPYVDHGIEDDQSAWYCSREGKQIGPCSWNQLYDLVMEQKLRGSDHILPPNGTEWFEVNAFSDLAQQ